MIALPLFLLLGVAQAPMAGPNEIPLEIAAKGVSIVPADKATIVLNLRCNAATSTEAKKLVRERADKLSGDLIAAGVPSRNVTIDEPTAKPGFIGNETIESMTNAAAQSDAKAKRSASLAVTVTFTDFSLLRRVQELLDQKDAVTLESPLFELSDNHVARRAAIADAIQKARTDADAYASSLGMRVARLTRIRDQDAQASPFGDYGELVQKFMQQKNAPNGKVETDVRVTVEFALAPR